MHDLPTRDLLLQAAGILAVVVGAVHGVLGEAVVFRRTRVEPPNMRLLLRFVWQASAVAWIGGGLLLCAAPRLGPAEARRWIVLTFAAVYSVGIVGNAWASRGRHFGWMLLSAAVALSLAGL